MKHHFDTLDETAELIQESQEKGEHIIQDFKGRYQGDIDPKTKLRIGTGTYTYSNNFF